MADSINFKFPWKASSEGGFQTNQTTIDAVIDDLKMLIITNHGDRVVHYDYGANLRPILFEQGPDVADQIRDAISVAVEKWMPFVTINEIQVHNSKTDPTLKSVEVRVIIDFSVNQLTGVLTQVIGR